MSSTEEKEDYKIVVTKFDGKENDTTTDRYIEYEAKTRATMMGRPEKYGKIYEKAVGETIQAALDKEADTSKSLDTEETKLLTQNLAGLRLLTFGLTGEALSYTGKMKIPRTFGRSSVSWMKPIIQKES